MSLEYHISLHEEPALEARQDTDRGILASAYEILDERNAHLPEARRVFRSTVRQIVSREPSEPIAYRAVIDFLNTVENPKTHTPTRHIDLLPQGHPLGTPVPRTLTASFYVSDPQISDPQVRELVAAAISSNPGSAARKYYVTRLETRKVPQSVLSIITDADETVL